jgi:hypothetical protein
MNAEFLIKLLCDVICYIFNEQTNIYREMGAGPAIVSQASARKSSVTSSSMCYIFFLFCLLLDRAKEKLFCYIPELFFVLLRDIPADFPQSPTDKTNGQ